MATDLAKLGALYLSQGRYAEARPLYERALTLEHELRWSPTSQVFGGLGDLARKASAEGRHEDAERIYRWALEVIEQTPGGPGAAAEFVRTRFAEYLRSRGRS